MKSPTSSIRRVLCLFAVTALLAQPALVGATDEPPTPAPGESLPFHAAGGWPTDTTGDDKKPARTPEQQANLDEVSNELKRLANDYGPDSVVLQAKLLVKAMAANPSGATEVGVIGASKDAGADYLEIRTATGLHFDAATTTAESRREQVWKDVAAPVLDEMKSFKIEPTMLELVFSYEVFDAADKRTPDGFCAKLPRKVLEDLIADKTTAAAVATTSGFFAPLPAAQGACGTN